MGFHEVWRHAESYLILSLILLATPTFWGKIPWKRERDILGKMEQEAWCSGSCVAPHPAMWWLLLLLFIVTLIGLYQSTNYGSGICQSTWRHFKGHVILKIRFTAEWSHDFVGGITAVDTASRRAILPLQGENKLLSYQYLSEEEEFGVLVS